MDLMKLNNNQNKTEILRSYFRYFAVAGSKQADEIKSYLSGELMKINKTEAFSKNNVEKRAYEILSVFAMLRSPAILHTYSYSNQNSLRFYDPMGLMSCNEQCQWLCGAGWVLGGAVVCGVVVGATTFGTASAVCALAGYGLSKLHCDSVCGTMCCS